MSNNVQIMLKYGKLCEKTNKQLVVCANFCTFAVTYFFLTIILTYNFFLDYVKR